MSSGTAALGSTWPQGVPPASAPHGAARAPRRPPGGSPRKPRPGRPLAPPSSATVTIAVRSPVTPRSALSEAASPCPPPSSTVFRLVTRCSLPTKVPVHHLHIRPGNVRDARRQLVGDSHAAVLAASAAHREGHEPLAFALVAGQHHA